MCLREMDVKGVGVLDVRYERGGEILVIALAPTAEQTASVLIYKCIGDDLIAAAQCRLPRRYVSS